VFAPVLPLLPLLLLLPQINSAGDFVYSSLPSLSTPADDAFTYTITDW
jgi:hypothetical protein